MADKKISALTSASTPLAGTEVLPIVQSGTTVKATVNNVTNRAIGPTSVAIGTALDGSLQSIGLAGATDGTTYVLNKWTPSTAEPTVYDLKFTTRFAGAGATAGWQYDFISRDFYTGSKTYLRFLGGNTVLPDGNLVISTSGKGIQGTTTNDSANAGVVGEFISSSVGSLVAMTSGTSQNATSISLTAGDWDVTGCIGFVPASTTSITALKGTIGTTSALYNDNSQYSFSDYYSAVVPGGSTTFYKTLPVQRISLASTTTVYLVAQATFGIAALYTGSCFIRARRVR